MTTSNQYYVQYDGAPYELYEFAEGAIHVTDNEELSNAATAYLEARQAFLEALAEADIEQG